MFTVRIGLSRDLRHLSDQALLSHIARAKGHGHDPSTAEDELRLRREGKRMPRNVLFFRLPRNRRAASAA
jgi:hypothetical protein